jgi:pimeloyl-ACP methyl ester carboxylesterase
VSPPARRLETVRNGAAEIATRIDGAGPTLVVLPSYGRDGLDDFDVFTDLLVDAGWRVLRPQPRGIAGSVGPMHGLDLIELADDVAAVVRDLAGGRAVILGHAFGNFIGRVLAVEHPDAVRGLILAAASASKVSPDIEETPFIAADPARPEAERLAALRRAFFAPGHDPAPWLRGWYPAALAMQHAAVAVTRTERYWRAGRAPLLAINAEHDPFMPPALRGELHAQVGERVTTVLIENAAHALFPEQPAKVAAAVLDWISRLP